MATPADGRWPQYLIERVLQAPKSGLGVVPGSTPVVAFGDPVGARVASLGINPSGAEFLDRSGRLLAGDRRRLATLPSLGVAGHDELTVDHASAIIDDCVGYFDRRPYHWFDVLEKVLRSALGVSYRERSACHLDLVQWATTPVWGALGATIRAELLRQDAAFLSRQLREGGYDAVVVNGRSVMAALARARLVTWTRVAVLGGDPPGQLSVGTTCGTTFIGWTCNLQSQPGARRHVPRLIHVVASLAVPHQASLLSPQRPGTASHGNSRPSDAHGAAGAGTADTRGRVPRGLAFTNKAELVIYFAAWLDGSPSERIGDLGTFGGKVWVTVESAAGRIGINSDTKREAVESLVAAAMASPGDGWRVVANRRGRLNRVLFSSEVTPGWYAYLASPLEKPGVVNDADSAGDGSPPLLHEALEPPGPTGRRQRQHAVKPTRETTASGPGQPNEPADVGERDVAIAQFPHPGGEHVPPGRHMPWNTGNHARKYLVAPGRYVDATGGQHDEELTFWGEWEAPSEVVRSWPRQRGLPTVLHRPFWSAPPDDGPLQNTDPWVFGDTFRYSNCRQLTRAPLRRPSAMQRLAPGSMIVFGSAVAGEYVIDTVFVVGRVLGQYVPAEDDRPGGDEAFKTCTLDALRSLDPEYAEATFTLYEGATADRPFAGMYSFVPCLPTGGRAARFARPPLRLPGIVNPRSTQSASGGSRGRSIGEVVDTWQQVVTQVLEQDLFLGVRFDTPPREASPARLVPSRADGTCGGRPVPGGEAPPVRRGGCGAV